MVAPISTSRPFGRVIRNIPPIVISIILLAIMIGYAPWPAVAMSLHKLQLTTVVLLVLLSLGYYGIKIIRFGYMLRALNIRQPWRTVAMSYLSAQPVTLLPGGEVYRSRTLEHQAGIPMRESIPTFTMQGLLEAASVVALGIVSVVTVGHLRLPAFGLAVVIGGLLIAVRRGYLAPLLRLLNNVPFIHISRRRIAKFSQGNQVMLSRRVFPRLFGLSLAADAIGAAVAYCTVSGLGGHISVFQAVLAYVVPLIVGFASLLPGGLGASEQSSIGILLLAKTGIAMAVAATLIIRVTIVGSGFIYGLIAMTVVRISDAAAVIKTKRAA